MISDNKFQFWVFQFSFLHMRSFSGCQNEVIALDWRTARGGWQLARDFAVHLGHSVDIHIIHRLVHKPIPMLHTLSLGLSYQVLVHHHRPPAQQTNHRKRPLDRLPSRAIRQADHSAAARHISPNVARSRITWSAMQIWPQSRRHISQP